MANSKDGGFLMEEVLFKADGFNWGIKIYKKLHNENCLWGAYILTNFDLQKKAKRKGSHFKYKRIFYLAWNGLRMAKGKCVMKLEEYPETKERVLEIFKSGELETVGVEN